MSIDRHTFENTSEDELEELSVPDQILGFSAVTTIARSRPAKSPPRSASTRARSALRSRRLKHRGLVEHKATYWAVTDDAERLDGYSGYEKATALFSDQLGAEHKKSWHEHAPQEPHPSVEDEQ
jgi:hypothetical protein